MCINFWWNMHYMERINKRFPLKIANFTTKSIYFVTERKVIDDLTEISLIFIHSLNTL
jgi:hypothetical protein